MKTCLLLIFCSLSNYLVISQSNPLESLKWQNRLLIIYSLDAGSEEYLVQYQNYKKAIEGYQERDLLVFHLSTDSFSSLEETNIVQGQQAKSIIDKLEISQNQKFQVSLLGKDGGVKLRSDTPISNEKLFNLIDSMPMRQNEMEERR